MNWLSWVVANIAAGVHGATGDSANSWSLAFALMCISTAVYSLSQKVKP